MGKSGKGVAPDMKRILGYANSAQRQAFHTAAARANGGGIYPRSALSPILPIRLPTAQTLNLFAERAGFVFGRLPRRLFRQPRFPLFTCAHIG